MANEEKLENPVVEEDPVVSPESEAESENNNESIGKSDANSVSSNKTIIYVIVSLVMAVFIYFNFLKDNDKKDTLTDNDKIVRNNNTVGTNKVEFSDIESAMTNSNKNTNSQNNTINSDIDNSINFSNPDLDNLELPQLENDLQINIDKELEKEIRKDNLEI